MRLLILTFYFPPDLAAGSFRAGALVQALAAAQPDLDIDVVTTLPNRYHSFAMQATEVERLDRVSIKRIKLPIHKSGIVDQARAFLTFARAAQRVTRNQSYDLVFATSSRLMTAVLAARLSRQLGAPLYSDIRDIFVDTIGDVFPRLKPMMPVFDALERFAVARSSSINLVSRGFAPYFEQRYPEKRLTYFTNGIDDEFLDMNQAIAARGPSHPITVLYAGNLGEGQGLHLILPELARRFADRVRFRVRGDGGRQQALLSALAQSGVDNVDVLGPVGRAELMAEYANADVLFVHLNDHEAFRKVLPSKLFEYGATGKPIWAGLAGHAADFVRQEMTNVALFEPCDAHSAEMAFDRLQLGQTDRSAFVQRFSRRDISRRMADDILAVLHRTAGAAPDAV